MSPVTHKHKIYKNFTFAWCGGGVFVWWLLNPRFITLKAPAGVWKGLLLVYASIKNAASYLTASE
jgi:hypothetical protein